VDDDPGPDRAVVLLAQSGRAFFAMIPFDIAAV
jgi:hypothetical protein